MKTFIRIIFSIGMVLGITACLPGTSVVQQTDPSAQPRAGESYHPLTARTGIDQVDHVLDAVASGDSGQLRSLIQFTEAVCTQREGLGGPPKCRAGESEGTLVEVLPFLGSEGSFIPRDEIGEWQGIDVSGLYAIYEVSPDIIVEEYYPPGDYAILFAGRDDHSPVALRLTDGRIVRVDYIAGRESLNAILEREASRLILAPIAP